MAHAPFHIGPYRIDVPLVLAPMAGVTDKPFRMLCKRLGAGLCVSEMTTSEARLWTSAKSVHRMDHVDEPAPISVQIAGTDPAVMAAAARHNVEHGAQIIDINMGCPAKKVCNAWAGSALMQDEALVARILSAVVGAVDAPVTLKIRTGWNRENRNAPRIARIAEVKAAIGLPVVANGDIDSPEKAQDVLRATGADAIMIGRAAQGRPWIFREIDHYLATGEKLPAPTWGEVWSLLRQHLLDHYAFYGEFMGVRTARKHIGWYLRGMQQDRPLGEAVVDEMEQLRGRINASESPQTQLDLIDAFFSDQERVLDTCADIGETLQ